MKTKKIHIYILIMLSLMALFCSISTVYAADDIDNNLQLYRVSYNVNYSQSWDIVPSYDVAYCITFNSTNYYTINTKKIVGVDYSYIDIKVSNNIVDTVYFTDQIGLNLTDKKLYKINYLNGSINSTTLINANTYSLISSYNYTALTSFQCYVSIDYLTTGSQISSSKTALSSYPFSSLLTFGTAEFTNAYNDIYLTVYNSGYQAGLLDAQNNENELIYQEGYETGYDDCYNEIYWQAYQRGYDEGILTTENNLSFNWFGTILKQVEHVLTLEIFPNIYLGYFLFFPIAAAILLFLIRLVK